MKRLLGSIAAVTLAWNLQAGPTLADCWAGRAHWVFDAQDIGADFHFHFVSFYPNKNDVWAYYIHNYVAPDGQVKMAVGRARGQDGLHWHDDGMVMDVGASGQWDDRIASFPGILKHGDTWYLVYEGAGYNPAWPGDIGLAESKDGMSFTKDAHNPILHHTSVGWERANIGTPSLYTEHGVFYLFYHGYDGNVCQIGVASGPSLGHLVKAKDNPIIPVSPAPGAWDSGTIGRRSAIIKEGRFYYMAFEGSTAQPYSTAKWSTGMTRSTNLAFGWTKFPGNPVIPQTTTSMGFDGPELLHLNGTWFLYVRMPANHGTGRFRLENK